MVDIIKCLSSSYLGVLGQVQSRYYYYFCCISIKVRLWIIDADPVRLTLGRCAVYFQAILNTVVLLHKYCSTTA